MNILILGSGGREHALAWKISQSSLLSNLYIAPGNAGTAQIGENVNLDIEDLFDVREFCLEHNIDFLVPGSEKVIAAGISDYLHQTPTFVVAPSRREARLETSKVFAKNFLKKYKINTPSFQVFEEKEKLLEYLKTAKYPVVIKADGLAGGKGSAVVSSLEEAENVLEIFYSHPEIASAMDKVLVENYIQGEELSLFLTISGEDYQILGTAKDYKRLLDNDKGVNTGGMGALSPAPMESQEIMGILKKEIIAPTIRGFAKEHFNYKGFLYIGIIFKNKTPYVLEYNVRLGDPETQALLVRSEFDMIELFQAMQTQSVSKKLIIPSIQQAVTLTLVTKGYPFKKPQEPLSISLPYRLPGAFLFHGNTFVRNNRLMTQGGRVFHLTAFSRELENARNIVYGNAEKIEFQGKFYRKDIGY